MKQKAFGCSIVITVVLFIFTGCFSNANLNNKSTGAGGKGSGVVSITAQANPSVAACDIDLYKEINQYILKIYQPDEPLYIRLCEAVDNMENRVDISRYDLSYEEKYHTCECLFGEAQYRFFYLDKVSLSKDGSDVIFDYLYDYEETDLKKETFYARLSHLLYNAVPQDYSDLQKIVAVYQYLCQTSGYSSDMQDPMTFSPYSILSNGSGICGGYASLAYYALSRMGVDIEYVGNDAHAWNIVNIGGACYHSDITFGAGYDGSRDNYLCYVLMDDEFRRENLESAGVEFSGVIKGYPGSGGDPAPACRDQSFNRYNSIYSSYAVDTENDRVYFNCDSGIAAMNLDCTGEKTVSEDLAFSMVCYDGVLYYLDYECNLYSLKEGESPSVMDDSGNLLFLELDGATLNYGRSYNGDEFKTISLVKYSQDALDAVSIPFDAEVMPRSRSFYIDIQFSEPMDADTDWHDYILLFSDASKPLDMYFRWNQDHTVLTIRPTSCIADYNSVTVYVADDAPTAALQPLGHAYSLKIDIEPDISAIIYD